MQIGFIGTGIMGSRMVARLLAAGYEISVYNRTKHKLLPLLELGAREKESIAHLAAESQIICSSVSMPDDVKEIYLGPGGVIDSAQEGAICVDFTTADADTSREVSTIAAGRGIYYLDAPVSGGPEGAEQGTLSIMVGGEKSAFDQVKDVIQVLGRMVEYLGPSGAGSFTKLINQYLVAVHTTAASEAIVAGAALGLDPGQLYRVLKESYGFSRMMERHMENFILKNNFEAGGAVKYVHKDVMLANRYFEKTGMSYFTGQVAEQTFKEAMEQGLSELDMSAVIKLFERQCGVNVKIN